MKILIIEDQEGMRLAITRYLEKLLEKFPHAEISFVSSLEDAWKILYKIPAPDVTFLDLGLPPHFDWRQTVESINAIDDLSPVIVMTGYPEAKVREVMQRPDIEVLEKGSYFWVRMWRAIITAISRPGRSKNMEKVDENIRLLRELVPSNGPSQ